MPSPIGHAIAGVIAGSLISPLRNTTIRSTAAFAAAGMAADFDLLVGAHSGPSHGLGAALVAGVVSWLILRRAHTGRAAALACALTVAYASHTLLDWLSTDSSPPIGIMALWPFSHEYYESPWHIFMPISRRYWSSEFWTANPLALAWELIILVPIGLIVLTVRGRFSRGGSRED
jgi:inner membrane protein